MNKHKLVYIEWQDAFANSGWFDNNQLDSWKKGEFLVSEIGWIIEETDKQIILASRYNPANNGDVEQWGMVHKIPNTWIRKRINLTKHIK